MDMCLEHVGDRGRGGDRQARAARWASVKSHESIAALDGNSKTLWNPLHLNVIVASVALSTVTDGWATGMRQSISMACAVNASARATTHFMLAKLTCARRVKRARTT